MKKLITILSVTDYSARRIGAGILALSFLFLSLPGFTGSVLLGETSEVSEGRPFVRIKWKQNFEGFLHKEFLVKDAHIVEVTEYSGVLMDASGHIAVYIPDPIKLSSPQGSFTVSDGTGKDRKAELIGVDQRMSLAFLKSSVPGESQAVFGQGIPDKAFSVFSWDGSEWTRSRFKLIEAASNQFGPVMTVKAVRSGRTGLWTRVDPKVSSLKSSFILDDSDRLIGLGVSASSKGLSRQTMEFKVFPVNAVRDSLRKLQKQDGGILESGWIGVYIDAVDAGIRVSQVVPESPAYSAGIMPGDMIVAINQQPLSRIEDFIQAVKWKGPDNDLNLTVKRDESSREYAVVLGRSPVFKKPVYEWALDIPSVLSSPEQFSQKVRFRPVPASQRRNLGIQVGILTSQLAAYFKSPTGRGLLVEAVESGSPAEQIGLKAGDVLIRIDNSDLKASSDLLMLMNAYQEPVILSFVRDGKVIKQKILFR